jgi:murein DD-endopeptidase MepM/ murein hydrolase activator NlpD
MAGTLTLDGAATQGGLMRGTTEPEAHVRLDGRTVRVAPDGGFIIGFGRDAGSRAILEVAHPDGSFEQREVAVATRRYDIQRVDKLPPATVTPDPAALERIRREAEAVRAARRTDSEESGHAGPLRWPATGPLSGVWGSQRILNGEPRAPHYGVDVAAPAGTPVTAAAAGQVTLAQELFLTGNTVVIDHGYGLSTTYAHMATLAVHPGQHVAQGQEIGTVGATGRATGPHLHWSAEWYEVRLDPALLAGPMPAAATAPAATAAAVGR